MLLVFLAKIGIDGAENGPSEFWTFSTLRKCNEFVQILNSEVEVGGGEETNAITFKVGEAPSSALSAPTFRKSFGGRITAPSASAGGASISVGSRRSDAREDC